MYTGKRSQAVTITIVVMMLAGALFLSGCKIVPTNDNSASQNSTASDSSSSTSGKDTTRPDSSKDSNNKVNNSQDSQNNSQSANRIQGDYSWPNGDKYHGQLLNGLPDGNGTLIIWNVAWDADWDCYIGEWKAGKINGYGKMELGTDGSYYEGNFKDNLPNGDGQLFDPFNGKEPKAGKWTTAKKNGQWYSTSDNGLSFYPLVPGE